MEPGQDEDDRASSLVDFRDGPGAPCTDAAMAGSGSPKNETGTPKREAAYQPVSGRPIMKMYSTACPILPRD